MLPSSLKNKLTTILPLTREGTRRTKSKKRRSGGPLDIKTRRMDSDASASDMGEHIHVELEEGPSQESGGGSSSSSSGGGGSILSRYYTRKEKKREQKEQREARRELERKREQQAKILFFVNVGLILLGWFFFWAPIVAVPVVACALVFSAINYLKFGRNNGSIYGIASGVLGVIHFVILFAFIILATLVGMFGSLLRPFG